MSDDEFIANLEGFLAELKTNHQELLSSIHRLHNDVNLTQASEVIEDFEKIKISSEKFSGLLQESVNFQELTNTSDLETLRHFRHDLRGAIGGVIGYSEIIEDTLTDIDNHQLAKAFSSLAKKASSLLPIIDNFTKPQEKDTSKTLEQKSHKRSDLVIGKILIVDDSDQKRDLLVRKLDRVGHKTVVASSGKDALQKVEENAPDLILLDLYMPEMNGDEVLKILKLNPDLKHIPVLMVSSSSDMENIVKCIQLGADDYLPMPLDETLLYARLNACLNKKLARDREREIQSELDKTRIRLNLAINNIDEGFAVFDEKDELVIHNNFYKELYKGLNHFQNKSVTYEELLRANVDEGVYQFDRRSGKAEEKSIFSPDEIEDWIQRKLSYHKNPTRPQLELLASKKWVEVIENKIPGGGVVAVHKDISRAKHREERLEFLALHDGLTGLANRKKFDGILEDQVAKFRDKLTTPFAVMFFDLDGFKIVNDTLGHDFGDFLLQDVAQKLTKATREDDLVARFGGDEFAAIITNLDANHHIETVAKRCLNAIGTSVEKDGQIANFGVSIGIAICPDHGTTAEEILKQADKAMYKAKKSGKGKFLFA